MSFLNELVDQQSLRTDDFTPKIDTIMKQFKYGYTIGCKYTRLSMKNATSYMVGTVYASLLVVENGRMIFLEDLRHSLTPILGDIQYYKPLNCYLLCMKRFLYRKDIDNKMPYIFMKVEISNWFSSYLNYSPIHHRIVTIADKGKILVLNPLEKHKEIEISPKKSFSVFITSLCLFGDLDNRVIAVSKTEVVGLWNLSIPLKKVLSSSEIQLENEEAKGRQKISCLSVCPKNK